MINIIDLNIHDIIPYEKNPRDNEAAIDKVAESIKQFGFKVPVIIDKNNVIVAGHTRVKAAEKLGIETIPCIKAADLNEEQVKAFRLADNKVSEFSQWDLELLSEELEAIQGIDMSEFGFDALEQEIEELREAPESFDEMEELETEHKCPKCGYEW